MNFGTGLFIQSDIVTLLKQKKILLADGSFDATTLDTLTEDLELASDIEGVLKAHGVNVPGRVDQVIRLLPIIADIVK